MLAAALRSVKRTPAYRTVHAMLAGSAPYQPVEWWLQDDCVYLTFDLVPAHAGALLPALVLFVVEPTTGNLLRAQRMVPDAAGQTALVTDLLQP